MAQEKDLYELLGVSKNASSIEIKKAYRKLALEHHPDRNKGKDTAGKFKELSKAYEILSDPQKRQTYDQFGSSAFEGGSPFGGGAQGGPFGGQGGPFTYTYNSSGGGGGGFDPGGFSDPFEIFRQFFGGESPFGGQRRQAYSLSISFIDAIKGVEKKVTIDGKTQAIKIPAGVNDGSRIRFGNYDIVVKVEADKHFQRQGYDIVSEEEITFSQAALGILLEAETVSGKVKLRIPSGTQPNTVFRLAQKGVPHLRGSGKGDHYVKIKIVVPKNLSGKQRELFKQLDEEQGKKKSWF
ncbi:DnaJ domain-containing protein [Patescibacteria group bacterium]|nr:DnaJ domain-containing protein [Patescibacteria group bacterium]